MKKVLIITRHYLSENNGGSNASKAHIRAISEIYSNPSLIYPEKNNESSYDFIPKTIKSYPCYDYRSKIEKGLDIYRGILHRFVDFVTNHLQKFQYDIIILDHSLTAAGIIDKIKGKYIIITIHHNVERKYIKDNKVSLLYRVPFDFYSKKAESDAIKFSDLNITLTEKDANDFSVLFPERAKTIRNMGTYQYKDLSHCIEQKSSNILLNSFVISGSLNFPQSEIPIIEFVRYYYPAILETLSDAQLIITGRNPSAKIIEVAKSYDSIKLIPNPMDINKVISECCFYICPINRGSGVKIRMMDGLKMGMPILAHTESVNGYEAIKKDGYIYEYHDVDTFKKALRNMLDTKIERQDVYESFYNYFCFDSGKKRLMHILENFKLR